MMPLTPDHHAALIRIRIASATRDNGAPITNAEAKLYYKLVVATAPSGKIFDALENGGMTVFRSGWTLSDTGRAALAELVAQLVVEPAPKGEH